MWFCIIAFLNLTHSLAYARYGVLLPQRPLNVSDKEQVVSLLDFIGAEDTQYQLGLSKVEQNKAFVL